jgi:ribosomal protein L35AE/L33A
MGEHGNERIREIYVVLRLGEPVSMDSIILTNESPGTKRQLFVNRSTFREVAQHTTALNSSGNNPSRCCSLVSSLDKRWQNKTEIVRIQVLTAASTKMPVFWVVAPFSLVKFTDVSEVLAASIIRTITSETSVNFYQTTRRNNPEDSHLKIQIASSKAAQNIIKACIHKHYSEDQCVDGRIILNGIWRNCGRVSTGSSGSG